MDRCSLTSLVASCFSDEIANALILTMIKNKIITLIIHMVQ